jgi:CRP-like cAMP-binding protein
MRMHYDRGELIFRQGDPANRFYLIEQGSVSLESPRHDEPPVAVQIIGPGDVLGWSWLFPPYSWNFDARAIEPTTAIFLYGTRLLEQCEENRDFGYEMMKRMVAVVIHRLQSTRKRLLEARS